MFMQLMACFPRDKTLSSTHSILTPNNMIKSHFSSGPAKWLPLLATFTSLVGSELLGQKYLHFLCISQTEDAKVK